ncbi:MULTISPECIES: hypothetical protein [Shinella]|jgi:hypothetical protein|uniref:hypothetical protein n=1 Tax=Shinella TaxID=323620 RepID=UPI0010542487|nr:MULTISPECIES: hypothetical protein [Shinella]
METAISLLLKKRALRNYEAVIGFLWGEDTKTPEYTWRRRIILHRNIVFAVHSFRGKTAEAVIKFDLETRRAQPLG